MKPQDILFFAVLAFLIYRKDSKLFVVAGIISLIISIPLFSLWVFFTAERLIWYSAGFFLFAVISGILKLRTTNE